MKVIWSEQAKDEVRRISDYILKEFGKRSRQNFMQEIRHTATLLETSPNIGQVEQLLENAPVLYRSIVVNRLSKIVYYIHNDLVEIVALWDTRQEPNLLKNNISTKQ